MTSVVGQPSTTETGVRPPAPWYAMREVWGGIAIVSMWLAVLFVGVYGGDIDSFTTDGTTTHVPSAILVALFAAIGTASVAKRAFGRGAPPS